MLKRTARLERIREQDRDRARRNYALRKAHKARVSVVIGEGVGYTLVRSGWLPEARCADKQALSDAISALLESLTISP